MRPKELSDDYVCISGAVDHTLDWLAEQGITPDYFCLILATAPFLRAEVLKKSFDMLKAQPEKVCCFGVTEFPFPIQRAIRITDEGTAQMFQPEHFYSRSQDLEPAYHDAGQFSWSRTGVEPEKDTVPWNDTTIPYVLNPAEVQDIDTLQDWVRAEAMYRALREIEGQQK